MKKRLWLGMVGAVAGLAALAGTSSAANASCSLATLTGEYTFAFTAYNPPIVPPATTPNPPIAVGEGVKFFDGNGKVLQQDYRGGTFPNNPHFATLGSEEGTYTVDPPGFPDCTGTLDITINAPSICPGPMNDGQIHALIVISDGGRHIHEVLSKFVPVCTGGVAQPNTPETSADDWKVAPEEDTQ